MKLLSRFERALSSGREGEAGLRLASGSGQRRPAVDAAGAIGERYETMNVGLDRLSELVEQLKAFEPALKEMRDPLQAEYAARRNDYVELVNLRSAHAETTAELEAASVEVRAQTQAREAAERRLDQTAHDLAERSDAASDAEAEVERLRTSLASVRTEFQSLAETGLAAEERIRRLEQDAQTAAKQLKEADQGRAEAAEGRAAAERDGALVSEENTALKRRLDEAQLEIARLARAEASLDGQLTAERARAQSDQSESVRAIQALEAQAETSRGEVAGLQVKVDTLIARSERLDRLNADLTARLNDSQTGGQTAERQAGQLQVELDRAMDKVRDQEGQLDEARQRHAATDTARQAAVERADHLAKSAAAAERSLARSEERAGRLKDQLDAARADAETKTRALSQQMEALRAKMQEAQAESAMTAAALEASRRARPTDEPLSAANA